MRTLESFRLDGQVAMITGGARHLGYDVAEALAEAGCRLAVTSRDHDRASTAARNLAERYRVETLSVVLDVTDYANVSSAADRVGAWKGRIDILINNAGGSFSCFGGLRLRHRT